MNQRPQELQLGQDFRDRDGSAAGVGLRLAVLLIGFGAETAGAVKALRCARVTRRCV